MTEQPDLKALVETVQRRSVVDPATGCHIFTGCLVNGYGVLGKRRKHYSAHRVAYEDTHGQIPPGLQIDHLCRNRACCNPDHLEAVTQRENIIRGEGASARHARQTHCVHGHEFTPENTLLWERSNGRIARRCRACLKAETIRRFGPPKRQAPTCARGHPRTPENTMISKEGHRRCLPCRREVNRLRSERMANA